ncbi:MAG: SDR family NAD(P)-dependent oxidoreductase [Gemmatimonadaceae bacterium]
MTDIFDFRGKVALLTGVGRKGQVGEAVADAFAASGARLIMIERQAETMNDRLDAMRAIGVEAFGHACDLTDATALSALVPKVAAQAPNGVHAMVHLAGGFASSGPIAESDPEVWHRQIAINLTTAYLTTRAFLPLVRAATGSIVYFASAAALPGGGVAELSAYAVAKTGVLTFMRAVAAEERTTGVRANALAPTSVRTATNIAGMGQDVRYVERETVARWVLYLTDPTSGPVSGQAFRLG